MITCEVQGVKSPQGHASNIGRQGDRRPKLGTHGYHIAGERALGSVTFGSNAPASIEKWRCVLTLRGAPVVHHGSMQVCKCSGMIDNVWAMTSLAVCGDFQGIPATWSTSHGRQIQTNSPRCRFPAASRLHLHSIEIAGRSRGDHFSSMPCPFTARISLNSNFTSCWRRWDPSVVPYRSVVHLLTHGGRMV